MRNDLHFEYIDIPNEGNEEGKIERLEACEEYETDLDLVDVLLRAYKRSILIFPRLTYEQHAVRVA